MFARWTTNYDCVKPTEWWYCIKDTPFDILKISSNVRYKINKGTKNFEVREIEAKAYAEELYHVQEEAFNVYSKYYRPTLDENQIIASIKNNEWNTSCRVFAAFHRETGQMAGYTVVNEHENSVELSAQKTIPDMQKLQVNAALVYAVVMYYNDRLSSAFYIVDGERNIKHETHFFEYLIRYFEFRLAYC